jgi:hypothetical protein
LAGGREQIDPSLVFFTRQKGEGSSSILNLCTETPSAAAWVRRIKEDVVAKPGAGFPHPAVSRRGEV